MIRRSAHLKYPLSTPFALPFPSFLDRGSLAVIFLLSFVGGVKADSISSPTPVTPAASSSGKPHFTPAQIEFFEKRIRPVLSENCYECHTGANAKNGLELDYRDGWVRGSDYRKIIDLKTPSRSVVILAVSHSGEKGIPSMPNKREKLPTETVGLLQEWIAMGLPWPEEAPRKRESVDPLQHWSFQPVKVPALPADAGNPIDWFIHRAQTAAGVNSAPRADRATLYRRLSFDLLGLPPRYQELRAFVDDPRPDQIVWAELVDRLLDSPHYGERWARLWMDVARYADTKGYEGGGVERRFIYSYTYRDWLIRAFNEDLPYDKFLLYQIAAEQLVDSAGPDRRHLAAMGFLSLSRNGSQEDILDDRIDTTFRGTMALTVSCAKCHDHKSDPIPTRDYYGLYGIFLNSLTVDTPTIGDPPKTPEYEKYAKELAVKQKEIDELLQAAIEIAKKENPTLAKNPAALRNKVDPETRKKLRELEGKRDKFVADSQMDADKAIILRDRDQPINQHVFIRGNPGRPGELAPRQFLSLVADNGEARPFTQGSGRLEMAKAITAPSNPLTGRNIVNRVWMWHFGEGIVRSIDDFGHTGERPDHPELLDWLADYFLRSGSSFKKLHRLILTSDTWTQQSSNPKTEANMLVDAENRLLWKYKKRRLEFEQMRDAMLDVAGNLDLALFGRPVEILASGYQNRRSVYAFIDRQNLNPAFRNFDFSNPQETTGKRPNTTIPMQALFTMNNTFVMDQAEVLARQTDQASDRIAALHHAVFAKDPTAYDRKMAEGFLSDFQRASEVAGKRQTNTEWSYGWGDIDADTGKVSFHSFPVWKGNRWQVGQESPLKDNPLSYLSIDEKGSGHPGYTNQESLVHEWRSPADLRIGVRGEIRRPNVGKGNGVRVKLASSSRGNLFDKVLEASQEAMSVTLPEVKLAKGECLYFIVDPRDKDSSFDSITWNPRIVDLDGHWPAWSLVDSFSGPAIPATPWGAYAQALLNANRFLFID